MNKPVERRHHEAELRAVSEDGQPTKIVGHAAVFDEWTTLHDGKYFQWREVIRPGAFANAIKKKQDVRALWNHDERYVIGRTKSGTLRLSEDERGLLTETVPPDNQTARDLYVAPIERGDVSNMSFAFMVRSGKKTKTTENADGSVVIEDSGQRITQRYEGEKLIEERELLDLDLFDISPVTYPAYAGTDVAMRSAQGIEKRVAEMDVPHKRPAPVRDGFRTWLSSKAEAKRARDK